MTKNIFYKRSCLTIIVVSLVLITLSLGLVHVNFTGSWHEWAYFSIVLLPLVIIGTIITCNIRKQNDSTTLEKRRKITTIWCLLLLVFILTILPANFKSHDYCGFLDIWTTYYKTHSLKDSLYNTIDVSNYAPAYNYILMLIARIPINHLYLIKYVTFLFSIYLAFIVCKIISKVAKEKFNYILFISILLLPYVLFEFNWWGQCDAIYVSFALTSFYFALCKKSKLSFLFIGLSFVFKLQFLFIVPILFVMLIVKDEKGEHYLKWKDIWIPIAMYSINLLPVFAGRSLFDLLLVYFRQANYDKRISGMCFNLCLIYQGCGVKPDTIIYTLLTMTQIILTLATIIIYLVIIFKNNKKKTLNFHDFLFWGFSFAFTMVFLMPKMIDRFYFIAVILSLIYMIVSKEKHACILAVMSSIFFSFSLIHPICAGITILNGILVVSGVGIAIAEFVYLIYVIYQKQKCCRSNAAIAE